MLGPVLRACAQADPAIIIVKHDNCVVTIVCWICHIQHSPARLSAGAARWKKRLLCRKYGTHSCAGIAQHAKLRGGVDHFHETTMLCGHHGMHMAMQHAQRVACTG